MDDRSRIVGLKLEGSVDRCSALLREVGKLRIHHYPSQGANVLLEFIEKATAHIAKFLREQTVNTDLALLDIYELELRMQRLCQFVPVLHEILGLLQGADVGSTPAEIIPPLRRLIRSLLPSAEILVVSTAQLNYSITEVSQSIREHFKGTPLEEPARALPPYFYIITIPQVESDQVLMHSMLSHEAGHGLYALHKIAETLLPSIVINHERINNLAQEIKRQQSGFDETEIRKYLSSRVLQRIQKWSRELASDAYGVHLFGPAVIIRFYSLCFVVHNIGWRVSDAPTPAIADSSHAGRVI